MKKPNNANQGYFVGEHPNTVCIIPSECLQRIDAKMILDQDVYISSQLHIKNIRANRNGIGGHLFPKIPLKKASPEQVANAIVKNFLEE